MSYCVLVSVIVARELSFDGGSVVGVVGGCVRVVGVSCGRVLVVGVACERVLVRCMGNFEEVVSGLLHRCFENEASEEDPAHRPAPLSSEG